MFRFSYFDGFYSTDSQLCELASWEQFIEYMEIISETTGYKPSPDESIKQGLISSGIYNPDAPKRCNDNVIGWDMVMLDIDDGIDDLNIVMNHFKLFNYIIYSSPSCTKDKLKIRVIIPLHKTAPSDVLSQIWHGCNVWCEGVVDPQTKDKARMMYIPARYTNKGDEYRHIFITNKGLDLNWESLIQKFPSPKESDRFKVQNELSKLKRKIYLNTNKIPDTNIRSPDCPFVYKNMIEQYMLTPSGAHHKAIYVFMVQVCYNAQKINYPISIDELVDLAKQLDDMDGSWYDDKKLYNSAKDAINYTGV